MARHFVTGGAGFIGSHLVDALLARGDEVVAYDNLSNGTQAFLAQHQGNARYRFVHADVMDTADSALAMKGADTVWHVAADPDVRTSGLRAEVHVQQNVVATLRVAARRATTRTAAAASTRSTSSGSRARASARGACATSSSWRRARPARAGGRATCARWRSRRTRSRSSGGRPSTGARTRCAR